MPDAWVNLANVYLAQASGKMHSVKCKQLHASSCMRRVWERGV